MEGGKLYYTNAFKFQVLGKQLLIVQPHWFLVEYG
jgi:hypothetical protein